MELIAEKTADFSTQFLLDIGAERIAPLRTVDGIVPTWVLGNLHKLIYNLLILRPFEMCGRPAAVYPAVLADLDPLGLLTRIDSGP